MQVPPRRCSVCTGCVEYVQRDEVSEVNTYARTTFTCTVKTLFELNSILGAISWLCDGQVWCKNLLLDLQSLTFILNICVSLHDHVLSSDIALHSMRFIITFNIINYAYFSLIKFLTFKCFAFPGSYTYSVFLCHNLKLLIRTVQLYHRFNS